MIFATDASLQQLIVHHLGNKSKSEGCVLAQAQVSLHDEILNQLLIHYFTQAFQKQHEIYHFWHPNDDLSLNEVYTFVKNIFNQPADFQKYAAKIAVYLHELSTHPNIKAGELYIAYFKDMQIEGELLDAIGIFKSEHKETYLKVASQGDAFDISYEQEAININKLDKGCLIFNTDSDAGFKLAVLDATNKSQEAVYWKDEFLKVRVRNDNYQKTNQMMQVCKEFISEKLDDEFQISKAEKIDLLNKSMKYFKENDTFTLDDYAEKVMESKQGIDLFKEYKSNYTSDNDLFLEDSFDIADAAVKKQARVYKSVLKLDKNFHIYIHGDKKLIEKGFDDDKSLNYYKVFFKEEN